KSVMPTAIMLDLQMPDLDGVEYLRILGERGCTANVIVMSGFDARILKTAVRLGEERGLRMSGGMQKPLSMETLKQGLNDIRRNQNPVSVPGIQLAVREKQFYLQYQPKIRIGRETETGTKLSLASGDWPLDSCEALIRWRHPTGGLIMPDSFIPFAEANELMVPLTEFVMHAMVDQLVAWGEEGFKPSIGFNVSPKTMTDLQLPDRLAELCDAAGIAHNRVIAEITETAAMTDVQRSMDTLTRLRLKGFRVAVDDFGTGYSSLVQLHRMPFTELKIDKSIIMELGMEEDALTITRSIIDLAHNLGMEVCAEGVETQACVDILRDLECDILQGYYFHKPVEAPELRKISK
ncbi:MAG: EAL domain-containing response regulator, partial [Rhodospirillales bacterium]